eukprot:15054969-Alexandrium_andersonii.AAC.1
MAASASSGESRWNVSGWAASGRCPDAPCRGLGEPSLGESSSRVRKAPRARCEWAGPSTAAPKARRCTGWRRPRLVARCL